MTDGSIFTMLAATGPHFSLLTTLAAGFAAAWILGLITHRLGLSPIVGYLLAGVAIGRHTPGFQGDPDIAQQLAEIGVILLMFGVGLHFRLKDLLAVRRIAIPGAVGQSVLAVAGTAALFHALGWDTRPTLVLGMSMSVASTVVLLRVLMDKGMLNTSHGHAAVGWLIVEDLFTVLALVLVPLLGAGGGPGGAGGSAASMLATLGWAVLKIAALVVLMLLGGSKVIPWVFTRVARLRSPELFTLTVLVLSIAIAVGSASLFGASVALGAFLAGMVVAQSPASHQAAADALPMRDAFAVLFFVSVGMLFDPAFLLEKPQLVLAGVVIVMVVKPLAALGIVAALGYPARTALTVALGLAQIGEFSFILASVAREHHLLPEDASHLLVATAMISITLNPLLFRGLDRLERGAQRAPWLWRLLNGRADRAALTLNAKTRETVAGSPGPRAIIVGYGPVGRVVDAMLRDAGLQTVVIDANIDTVRSLTRGGRPAIFGDAGRREVLEAAGIAGAAHVVLTLPNPEGRADLVLSVREMNAAATITVRARYLAERDALRAAGATHIVCEEGEAGVALARLVLESRGIEPATIGKMLKAIRTIWKLDQ